MALPNPSMSFTPFDILTAAEMNDLVENIEALAAGTAFAANAILNAAIANDAVASRNIDYVDFPSVIANTTTAQTLVSGAFGTVIFTVEVEDNTNSYNNATGVFTVPTGKGGKYVVNSTTRIAGLASQTIALAVYKNGVEVYRGTQNDGISGAAALFCNTVLVLVPTDQVTIRGLVVGTNRNLDAGSFPTLIIYKKSD